MISKRAKTGITILFLLFGGIIGSYDSIASGNVFGGIASGALLGLVPMGWNELMTMRGEDVNER